MRFSSLTDRLAGESAQAWSIHTRAARRKEAGEDVILLSIGDPDFDTPPAIVEAAFAGLRAGRTHYTPAAGTTRLREAVARHHERGTGRPTGAQNVVIVPGAQCGLYTAAMCVLEAGDAIIVPEPMYVTYEAVVNSIGAELIPVSLRPEDDFHIDPRALEAAIAPNVRALLINTPHNPTGAVTRRETLDAIDRLSAAHGWWVLSDEVYGGLTFDEPHVSAAAVGTLGERSAIIGSLSKTFAMTGWRIGWVIAPEPLAAHMENLLGCMLYGSPPFVQDAAAAALEHDLPEVSRMKEAYRARRDLVYERLSALPRLACHRPEGGMYVMLDVRRSGLTGVEFADRLLDRQGLSLLPGEGFGASGAGHVRFSLCAPSEVLAEACRRLEAFVRSLDAELARAG